MELEASIKKALQQSISYESFLEDVIQLVKNHQSSGNLQTEELVNYTKLNSARLKRLTKTQKVNNEISKTVASIDQKQTWIVITESWCGDAAQTVPVIYKTSELSNNIDFKIVYRDLNPELMNHYLTNGNQAIPKLIVLDENKNVLADWGPRPTTATQLVNNYKKEHGGLSAQFKEDLQVWYNKNKGLDTLNDLNTMLLKILKKEIA